MAKMIRTGGGLSWNTTDFTTKMNAVSKRISGFSRGAAKDIRGISKSTSDLGKNLMVIGGASALAAVAGFKSLAAGGKELSEISKQLTISTDSAKKLQFAAKMGGLEFQDFASSISKMQKALGSGKGNDSLKSLGLDPKEIKAMSSDQAFETIIAKLSKFSDVNKRAAIASDLFGKSSGFKMLRFIGKDGSNDLQKYLQVADEMGVTFSAEKAKQFEEFTLKMTQLNVASKSLGNTLILNVAPYITGFYEWMLKATIGTGKFVKEHKTLVKWLTLGAGAFSFLAAGVGASLFIVSKFLTTTANTIDAVRKIMDLVNKLTKAKKLETAAEIANTAAVEANTVAKAENAAVGAGAGVAGGIGFLGSASAITAGAVAGGYAGYQMYKAGWANEGAGWGIGGAILGGTGRLIGDWWGNHSADSMAGDRTKQLIAQGRLDPNTGQSTNKPDPQMEANNKHLQEINNSLKQIASNSKGNGGGITKMTVPAFS